MGGSFYNAGERKLRAAKLNYVSAPVHETFQQQKEEKAHESMLPKRVGFREARDSENHPTTIPFQLYLDVTGSMGKIPVMLIKEGLPTLMSTTIQRGAKDAALLFGAIGDHECDRFPFQVGQFESGDEELDMWLTRTYLEGRGGGNAGESYLLAWYFAAFHTVTDAWEKRKHKTCLFTTGDEPCLTSLPSSAITEIFGEAGQSMSDKDLLKRAQEKYDVYHLHIMHSSGAQASLPYWQELLGQKCIQVPDYTQLPHTIADIVVRNYEDYLKTVPSSTPHPLRKEDEVKDPPKDQQIIL